MQVKSSRSISYQTNFFISDQLTLLIWDFHTEKTRGFRQNGAKNKTKTNRPSSERHAAIHPIHGSNQFTKLAFATIFETELITKNYIMYNNVIFNMILFYFLHLLLFHPAKITYRRV